IAAERGAHLRVRHANLMARVVTEFGLIDLEHLSVAELQERTQTLIGRSHELRDFLAIRQYRTALIQAGLEPFLAKADEMKLAPERLPALLEAIRADRRAAQACSSPKLDKHSGATLDARRRLFADRDRAKIRNDRALIRAKLLQKRPLPGSSYGPKK